MDIQIIFIIDCIDSIMAVGNKIKYIIFLNLRNVGSR